VMAGFNWLL